MEYNLIYLTTENLDENSKIIHFMCQGFRYHARCFDGVIQYVKGEYPKEYMNREIPPTDDEILEHDIRRKIFNANHNIIQTWIDGLN